MWRAWPPHSLWAFLPWGQAAVHTWQGRAALQGSLLRTVALGSGAAPSVHWNQTWVQGLGSMQLVQGDQRWDIFLEPTLEQCYVIPGIQCALIPEQNPTFRGEASGMETAEAADTAWSFRLCEREGCSDTCRLARRRNEHGGWRVGACGGLCRRGPSGLTSRHSKGQRGFGPQGRWGQGSGECSVLAKGARRLLAEGRPVRRNDLGVEGCGVWSDVELPARRGGGCWPNQWGCGPARQTPTVEAGTVCRG